ncbi:hypothetical protein PSEHALCIP103_03573 [Pseudoalteromonas haloplanktis]|uniref:Apea-like HEPN domain-containing protein n=1 Tax=Pseudoalteromonas haloplanktis TaxID=228 RepID=A0A9W4R4J2_PSEHA|nr:hypothetical protein [Pseudoalteromonas haloplanktis]CAH9066373.1 hypothetical protein PSEHALCIP103_03573 [Pseudoalteromonas haloplanktis]
MEQVFRHLHMPPELACEFLAVFSRMEYALKATRFQDGNEDRVSASWNRFANEADDIFDESSSDDLQEAVNYMTSKPPRKQVLVEGRRVEFRDFTKDANQRQLQQLLLMVRIVRNNLFHGGKHLPTGENEAGRNEMLVRHSLSILRACSILLPDVRESYEH